MLWTSHLRTRQSTSSMCSPKPLTPSLIPPRVLETPPLESKSMNLMHLMILIQRSCTPSWCNANSASRTILALSGGIVPGSSLHSHTLRIWHSSGLSQTFYSPETQISISCEWMICEVYHWASIHLWPLYSDHWCQRSAGLSPNERQSMNQQACKWFQSTHGPSKGLLWRLTPPSLLLQSPRPYQRWDLSCWETQHT